MDVQPIEKNTVTYFLFFEKENLTIQIDKPDGLEKADFEIKQNSNGYGRYLAYADGLILKFNARKNHQFHKLCDVFEETKWQSSVYFMMKVNDLEVINARLNFKDAYTDFKYDFNLPVRRRHGCQKGQCQSNKVEAALFNRLLVFVVWAGLN